MDFHPRYDIYRQILHDLMESGKLCSFSEALTRSVFVVLRHDIEFSVERAFSMSLLESELGVCSTYFVQLANNAYNAFSEQNADMLRDMYARGHEVGLHYHIGKSRAPDIIRQEIEIQCGILEKMLEIPIRSYSMHRPAAETHFYAMDIPGLINAYAPTFFSFVERIDDTTTLDVKYIADSQHRWNYGYPDAKTICSFDRIQLLIHPDFWSDFGYEAKENFMNLIKEHTGTFISTIDGECKHFHVHRMDAEQMFYGVAESK